MLDANLKAQLAAYLERIDQPVEIVASLDDTPGVAPSMRALLKDIADASPLVTVTRNARRAAPHALVLDQPRRARPRPALRRPAHGPRIHLAGAGAAAGRRLSAQGRRRRCCEQIRALDGDFEFEIYVSLTCHNCPDVVQALNLMAVQNPRIKPP